MKRPGFGARYRPWDSLPIGITLRITEAAALLGIKKESLRQAIRARPESIPGTIEVIHSMDPNNERVHLELRIRRNA